MPALNVRELLGQPPRQPTGRNSYSEQTDETGKLLDEEPVEIERELPVGDNSPIERTEPNAGPLRPCSKSEAGGKWKSSGHLLMSGGLQAMRFDYLP